MPIKRDEPFFPETPKPQPIAAQPKAVRKPKEKPLQGSVHVDYKPPFIRWYENDFWSDRSINRMTWMQRHYYRAILLAAFFCPTRPYLPDDDFWHHGAIVISWPDKIIHAVLHLGVVLGHGTREGFIKTCERKCFSFVKANS